MDEEYLKTNLEESLKFFHQFQEITASFIIEFFTHDLWSKLPLAWQQSLRNLRPAALHHLFVDDVIIDDDDGQAAGLMDFKKSIDRFSVCKKCTGKKEDGEDEEANLRQLACSRHVNPKKKHEIGHLAPIIKEVYKKSNCNQVYDFGSGQGHLSRHLTVLHGLRATGLERSRKFVERAKQFDRECEKSLNKMKIQKPNHVCHNIDTQLKSSQILQNIETATPSGDERRKILLTGLHACGDLSATMIRIFGENEQVGAVVSVACCYMRMTLNSSSQLGYPMSSFVSRLDKHEMEYGSLRTACHSTEQFIQNLKGDSRKLRLYCHRAVLEYIIRKEHRNMERPNIDHIKSAHELSFEEYVSAAFTKLNLPQPDLTQYPEVNEMTSRWRDVVTYCAIGILIGPVIESIILQDRCLYLVEKGFHPKLQSIFQPSISPRSFVIIATK